MDCTIICGTRGKAEQNKYFEEGKSKLKWPNSKHNRNPSLAVDVAPFLHGSVSWKRDQLLYFAGYVQSRADQLRRIGVISHEIRLGADFNMDGDVTNDNFKDEVHFELILNPGE
jgi:peptidoglycan L-alanyl-D-glutamate endopeptidase CwlK